MIVDNKLKAEQNDIYCPQVVVCYKYQVIKLVLQKAAITASKRPEHYEYITIYLFIIIRGSSRYSITIILKMLHNILYYNIFVRTPDFSGGKLQNTFDIHHSDTLPYPLFVIFPLP